MGGRVLRKFGRSAAPLLVVCTLLLSACSSKTATGTATPSAGNSAGKTIALGAVLSLTGSGGIYGPQQKNGILLAEEEINQGGINGAKLGLTVVDDQSDKTQGAQQFQTLIQQGKVVGIIGPTLSNTAVGAHPVADQNKTPVIAPSNTGNGIVGTCPYNCTYIFRDSLGEAAAIPANLQVAVAKLHPTNAALAFANDDKFSSDGAEIFKTTFSADHINLIDTEAFSKIQTDFSTYATSIIAKKPDVVAISGVGGVPSKLIVELRRQKYAGPILGGNGFNSSAVSMQAGPAGVGAQSGSAWYLGTTTTVNTNFVAAYKTKFNAYPDQFAAQAYTAVYLFAEAARHASLGFSDVAKDRDALRAALEKVSLDTPLGPFSFTSAHDVHQPIYVVAMDGSGGFTLVDVVHP
ncbi:MAG: branched-chain amino acid transport system substrate-binding protein [Actinomycetota bacterium]|nr:branched-chain amino acid transport system substrate-binding protein [Actinomycetota bacterium]